MNQICILLNGPIKNDSRVRKVIKTLLNNNNNNIDLYYVFGDKTDELIFNGNISLFAIKYQVSNYRKLLRHTFFYNEFNFIAREVLKNKKQYDYVWANDLPCLKPAVKIKKKTGAKLIYDSHEIYNETLNQFFPKKAVFIKSLIFKALLLFMRFAGFYAEKKLLKKTDFFVTVGNELRKYFEQKYQYKGIKILMNCPDIKNPMVEIDLKSLLGIKQSSKLVIYQGVLNYGRGLHLMIESFRNVSDDIYLLILGSGMIKHELVALVKQYKLENKVLFHEKVSLSTLPSYTAAADFGINLLEDINLSKKYAVPNKLFEYIHAGLPVISSKMPESVAIYKEFCIGKLVENDPHKIAEAINNITMEDITDYRKNCKLAANKYNWENQVQVLKEIFK
ncbi:MAG: glycosyltransferase [Bacteroidales bacterium]|nr:glycosyltransferase [Bacteroidales bacterium]